MKKLTEKLDEIATVIESYNPYLALKIDKISDQLDKKSYQEEETIARFMAPLMKRSQTEREKAIKQEAKDRAMGSSHTSGLPLEIASSIWYNILKTVEKKLMEQDLKIEGEKPAEMKITPTKPGEPDIDRIIQQEKAKGRRKKPTKLEERMAPIFEF